MTESTAVCQDCLARVGVLYTDEHRLVCARCELYRIKRLRPESKASAA